MLPEHALPQLILGRTQATLKRLKHTIWRDKVSLNVTATAPQTEHMSLAEAKKLPREAVLDGTSWGRLFDQRFCHVELPSPADGGTWFFWHDQGEATLYVDGEAYFGLNVAHRHCRLPKGAKEVWLQSSCVQSAIWHDEAKGMLQGSLFKGAWLAKRNDVIWNAYHDLSCLFDLAMDMRSRENPKIPRALEGAGLLPIVDSFSPAYRLILRIMNEAIDAYELDGPQAMRDRLARGYESLKQENPLSECILTGHAHVDLVWIWPERIGELKAVNVFATANRLLEEYDDYRFAYSQPASYEAVAQREPGLYEAIRDKIQTGAWQATGAMYVESDTIFACGEALARSFVIGQQEFKNISGQESRLTWLPDVFGYSACLPQIMKQTGVDYFFTTKMTWNAINRFPYSTFIWRGNDGSEILSHVTQDSGYVNHMKIEQIKATMNANQQADLYPEYLLPMGYGDGGGGPTDEMIERSRRLGNLPGMPSMRWDQPEAFFERLDQIAAKAPVYQGECYLEYHRGTYTTHGNLKAAFRGLERALQAGEAAAAATGQKVENTHAWKRLIFSQFHDYIPGSSVWDVYVEGIPELEALAQNALADASTSLSKDGEACLFNPHAVPVTHWTEDGKAIELAPLRGTPVSKATPVENPGTVTLAEHSVDNGLVSFRLNQDGWIEQLDWEGVSVPLSAPLGSLYLYPDRAANFESWDIDRHVLSLGQICNAPAEIETISEGSHRAGYKVTRKVGKQSSASVTFLLKAGSPLVHIDVELDWQEEESLLKLHFPTRYAAPNARFGIPYGSVLRPQQAGSMTAEAMWEVPFNRYLAVFDDSEREGLFVISEAKYGASVRDGQVGVSLVRSPKVTGYDLGHGHAWPAHLTRLENITPCSDIGAHSIKLAIGRHEIGLPRHRQPAMLADTLFTPALPYQGSAVPALLESIEGGDTLIPSWAKPAEGSGWILRLHEVAGQRGKARISFSKPVKLALTRLDEAQSKPLDSDTLAFQPYEVISLHISA